MAQRVRRHGGHRLARMTAAGTLILLIIGALVTSNDAGDSVPDWPTAFGRLLPLDYLVGNVVYEYTHRVVAATVGLLTIVLNLWLWWQEERSWVRRLGVVALLAVVAQGALGGVRVLLLEYRVPVAIVHATLAQLFFSLTVVLSEVTSQSWLMPPSGGEGNVTGARRASVLAALSVAALFVQLILGAAYRHRAIGIVPHAVGAGVVAVLLILVVRSVGDVVRNAGGGAERPSQLGYLRRPAVGILGVLALQVPLGIAAYVARRASIADPQPMEPMVSLTVSHVAGGAVLLGITLIVMLRLQRLWGVAGVGSELSAGLPETVSTR